MSSPVYCILQCVNRSPSQVLLALSNLWPRSFDIYQGATGNKNDCVPHVQAVEKHFWSDPDCRPADPSEEELSTERRHFEGVRRQQLSNKVTNLLNRKPRPLIIEDY